MVAEIDLDAYLRRIGHTGPRAPTLETLRAVHLRHPEAIAFENLDPLLGRPVHLDAASLERKLVHGGRGGYCFEQNLLFGSALRSMGFRVTGLAARVLRNTPGRSVMPRGHMLLRVDLDDGPWLADVGFGGLTLTAPLRLEEHVEQSTPLEPFRLVRAGDEFVMEAKIRGAWTALYRLSLQEQLLPDYEVTSWYLSNHPGSPFRTSLMAARADPDRRYALRNNEFAVHPRNGRTARSVLTDPEELREVLRHAFRLALPDAPEMDSTLERLTRGGG